MMNELYKHQAWADAAILQAVRAHPEAGNDQYLRRTLHHIVMGQRAFLSLFLGRPFDIRKESQTPESLADLVSLFRDSHREELSFVSNLQESELTRVIEMPWIQVRPSLAEALVQVVMHSQNHRGQCLSRLRTIAGNPPTLDFILWLKDRPRRCGRSNDSGLN